MERSGIAFVSDFDGTISDDDFFAYTTKAYFDTQALAPWRAYLAGQKTHFQALKEMFSQIRVPAGQFHTLIDSIKTDKDLEKTWRFCHENGIPLYVCSAGNDYYIRRLIGGLLKKYQVTLVSNSGEYSSETGLTMTAPDTSYPYYDPAVGISKLKVVEHLKKEGYFVVFAGDGPPDVAPAQKADAVFAKKFLLQACREKQIPTLPFNGFQDILTYLQRIVK